jgi:hypothetical protein
MDLLIEELGFLQVLYPLKKLREAAVTWTSKYSAPLPLQWIEASSLRHLPPSG